MTRTIQRATLVARIVALGASLTVTPAAAQDRRYDCGSFVRPLDAQDIAYRSRDGVAIRDALTAYCAQAAGRSRRYCALVTELVTRAHCPFELHPAHGQWPLVAAIGIHPTHVEWVWYLVLWHERGAWRVTRIFFDDLEHP
jgi:hypothetical protein